jgi:hypothetical protein
MERLANLMSSVLWDATLAHLTVERHVVAAIVVDHVHVLYSTHLAQLPFVQVSQTRIALHHCRAVGFTAAAATPAVAYLD